MQQCDVAIVGGGIVGTATAYRVQQRFPQLKLILLEKEAELGLHQTGRNSGVLHSGIYYRPGSLRAENCREGKLAMQEFCEREHIPYDICGKVIVAVSDDEVARLHDILERGRQNGVTCELIDRDRLHEIEPHAAGVAAIHVPEAGIVDYRAVCLRLAELVKERGGEILTNAQVRGIRDDAGRVVVQSKAGDVQARWVITCAGLQSDRVIRLSGQQPPAKIVPFRGEYYTLKPEARHLCRGLIYPVPDPRYPFLGVHFTRMIDGGVECGPNAVLAFAREGYRMRDINPRDLYESLTYPGFLRMAMKNWKTGFGEMWRSVSKSAFVTALQRLVPEIRVEQLVAAPAGVRAQALGKDGKLIDDFVFEETEHIIHVGNAPSPAATASLNIGKLIVDKLATRIE